MYKLRNISAIFILASVFTFAQTSGPTQPDFMKFSQINLGNNVNEFDGSFNYSIPVLAIPSGNKIGYSLNLTYQSGMGPNEEATWVGFGWSLNPGSIVRQVKGFPDDFDGVQIKFINNSRRNITKTDKVVLNGEYISQDEETKEGEKDKDFIGPGAPLNEEKRTKLSLGLLRNFNNYSGYTYTFDTGLSGQLAGIGANLNTSFESTGDYSLSLGLNPQNLLNQALGLDMSNFAFSNLFGALNTLYVLGNGYWNCDYGKGLMPMNPSSYQGSSQYIFPKVKFEKVAIPGTPGWGLESNLHPSFSSIKSENHLINKDESINVYGFMNSGKGYEDPNGLMDYYNEKEPSLSLRSHNLPIPFNNADNFIVSGNGVGGNFKLHSRKIGLFKPKRMRSTQTIENLFDLTLGASTASELIVGIDPSYGYCETILKSWDNFANKNNTPYDNSLRTNQSNFFYPYSYNNYIKDDNRKLSITENYFFKFHNDLTYSESPYNRFPWDKYNVNVAALFAPLNLSVDDEVDLSQNENWLTEYSNGNRVARSSLIDFNFFYENTGTVPTDHLAKINNLNTSIDFNSFGNIYDIPTTNPGSSKIKEFKIVNKDGSNYVYGLPVLNSDEVNVSYNVNKVSNVELSGTGNAYSLDGKIILNTAYTVSSLTYTYPILFGNAKIQNEPYAGTFLLTNIFSQDYVDVKMDGPTNDDLGDYVLFHYRKVDGTLKWREPFIGLNYSKNSNSDAQDDQGSVSYGKKELYYLESIETKTHIAIFVTNKYSASNTKFVYRYKVAVNSESSVNPIELEGSNSERQDAFQPEDNEVLANGTNYDFSTHPNKLEYLEKIVLFSKDMSRYNEVESGKRVVYLSNKVQVTNFAYDENYPIWTGMPNSKDTKGKLTLKNLWTDREDVKDEMISKYEFNYTYPNSAEYNVTTSLTAFHSLLTSDPQTPGYSRLNIDKWGNYTYLENIISPTTNLGIPGHRSNSENNVYSNSYLPFNVHRINQLPTKYGGSTDFYDPAAWNLKHIKLPNSGETVIHYERNNYAYVQAEPATQLFSLKDISGDDLNRIRIDLKETVDFDPSHLDYYVEYLKSKILNKEIYYKYYYKLNTDITGSNLFDCNHDYVDGYFNVEGINPDIRLGAPDECSTCIRVTVTGNPPKEKCEEFFDKRRNGLTSNNNCDVCQSNIDHIILNDEDKVNARFKEVRGVLDLNPSCSTMSNKHSFIKLPLPEYIPKYGGGVRVKRILNYDNFDKKAEDLSTTAKKVYGNEYYYGGYGKITKDNGHGGTDELGVFLSSGVATNEPNLGNEENALKQKVKLYDDEDLNKFRLSNLFTLKYVHKKPDREEYEGPFCEGILPSPKVNYSKIIIKSLQVDDAISSEVNLNNKSIVVKEFNTVKDFPYNYSYTFSDPIKNQRHLVNGSFWTEIKKQNYSPLDLQNMTGLTQSIGIGVDVQNYDFNYAQSYQFIINSMHGQPKSVATYAANDLLNYVDWKPGSYTKYEYFNLGEPLPIVDKLEGLTAGEIGQLHYDWLGTYIEYNNESRNLRSELRMPFLDTDFKIQVVPPYALNYTLNFKYTEKIEDYRYFTSNKIVTLPSFVKKVTNLNNGILSSVENVAFDPITGDVAIRKINDNYKNIAQSGGEQFPNSNYFEFNLKNTLNPTRDKQLSEINKAELTSNPVGNWENLYNFQYRVATVGSVNNSFLQMVPNPNILAASNACEIFAKFNRGDIIRLKNYNTTNYCYYVIKENQCDILHIEPLDATSVNANNDIVDIKIIKSGNTNQLENNVASIVTFGNDTINKTSYPRNTFQVLPLEATGTTYPTSNYTSPLHNWSSPINLRNILNGVLNDIASGLPSNAQPFADYTVLTGFDDYTTVFNSSDLFITNSKGDCVTLKINQNTGSVSPGEARLKISYKVMNFINNTDASCRNCSNYTGVCYFWNHNYGGTDYRVEAILYHLLIRLDLIDEYGITRTQVLNSYISDFQRATGTSITPVTNPASIGLQDIALPYFYYYNDNDLQFFRYRFTDISGFDNFIPSSLTGEYTDEQKSVFSSMGATHFNRSWCDKVGMLNACEYNRMDLYTDDKKIISADVSEYKEYNKKSLQEFSYLDRLNEANLTGTTFNNNLTVLSISTGNDVNDSYNSKKDLVDNYVLKSSAKLKLKNNYQYTNSDQNQTSTADVIVDSDNQSVATGNGLYITAPTVSIVNGGTYSNSFTLFNWTHKERNSNWLKTNTITYNNQLNPLIQQNAYGIVNGIGYDNYYNVLPNYVINRFNPKIAIVEDMENYNELFLHSYNLNELRYYKLSEDAHTGRYSFIIDKTTSTNSDDYFVSTNMIDKKYLFELNETGGEEILSIPNYKVSFWVKTSDNYDLSNILFKINILATSDNGSASFPLKLNHILQNQTSNSTAILSSNLDATMKLQIHDWYLFEVKVASSQILTFLNDAGNADKRYLKLKITRDNTDINLVNKTIFLDDVRLVPEEAEVNAYVYDWKESYKMTSMLDNENIPIKFIYDDKGDLKSKVAATYKGMRTINESFYNIPKSRRVDVPESTEEGEAMIMNGINAKDTAYISNGKKGVDALIKESKISGRNLENIKNKTGVQSTDIEKITKENKKNSSKIRKLKEANKELRDRLKQDANPKHQVKYNENDIKNELLKDSILKR